MKMTNIALVLGIAVATSGCATKEYVHEYVQAELKPVNTRLDALEGGQKRADAQTAVLSNQMQGVAQDLQGVHDTLKAHEARLDSLSKTAQEALDRANAVGALAQGKLLYEVVMTDDQMRFGLEKADLSEDGKVALQAFADRVKAQGKPVFIEIQGHTDSTGPTAYNLKLGEQRAESVRRYLHRHCGLPLARMASISYGESEPMADNKTRDGRKENRRVVLMVMQ